MTKGELESVLRKAVTKLFEDRTNAFTAETRETEWNLAQQLAFGLQEYFPSLDCDVEVIKTNYGNKRPDIIFHKRGTNESNYLVIEVKKDGKVREIAADVKKIHEGWFRKPLHYRFGAVVDLRTDGRHKVQVLKNKT